MGLSQRGTLDVPATEADAGKPFGFQRRRLFQASLFIIIFLAVVCVQRPARFDFFGDSWDVLYSFLLDPRVILQPHNEHFIPLFKALYFLQYKLFGAHHVAYMLVLFAFHSFAALMVYRLGKGIHLSNWSSVAAAFLFALNSASWEVTGWSFEQGFALGTALLLLSADIALGTVTRRSLVIAGLFLLLGCWAGGPIMLSLPLAMTAYWALRAAKGWDDSKQTRTTLSAFWVPAVLYLITVRASVAYTLHLASHPTAYPKVHLGIRALPEMLDFSFYGAVWGLLLPTLTFIHSQALVSSAFILLLLALTAVVSYRELTADERLFAWFNVFLLFFSYLVISVGRLSYGVLLAASSRYQYLSSAPLALLLVLCWEGLGRKFASEHAPFLWRGISVAVLAYCLLFHIRVLRKENVDADRGRSVQNFLRVAQQATFPSPIPAGAVVMGPEFAVPAFVVPAHRPLWMILQVLERNTRTVVPVGNYLSNESRFQSFNFVPNPGFETSDASEWRGFAGAQFSRSSLAAHRGQFGITITLPQHGSAFSANVIDTCPSSVGARVFTFAVEAKTTTPNALLARTVFKAADGSIVGSYASEPHSGDGQWHQLVTGGLSPSGACTVAVDLANDGNLQLSAMADDALLLLHPGTVDGEGRVTFQLPSAFSNRR